MSTIGFTKTCVLGTALLARASFAQQPCQLDTWSEHYLGADRLKDIAYGANLFVAVGTAFYASSNTIFWTSQPLPMLPQYSLSGVAYGNGRFVAVGNGLTYVSTNGTSWQPGGNLPEDNPPGTERISFGGGVFLAVSQESNPSPSSGTHWLVMTSSDGLAWNRQSGPTNNGESYYLSAAAYGNGTYLVAGWFGLPVQQALVLTSTNLAAWTPVAGAPASNYIKGVTYANGTFVAVGSSILTSPDGLQWTTQLAGPPAGLWAVTFGSDECFVAAGTGHFVLTSSNAVNWTPYSTMVDGLSGITYGNGSFVAVGEYFTDVPRGSVLKSGGSPGSPQGYLQAIGFGQTGSGFRLSLNAVGGTYRLQSSTSWPALAWKDIWTSYVGYPTTVIFDDSTASRTDRQRFYRVLSP